jgi:hypothetical protein
MDEVHHRGGVLVTSRDKIASDLDKLGVPSHWLPKSKVYVCEIEAKEVFRVPAWNKNKYSTYIAISKYHMIVIPQETVDNENIC